MSKLGAQWLASHRPCWWLGFKHCPNIPCYPLLSIKPHYQNIVSLEIKTSKYQKPVWNK